MDKKHIQYFQNYMDRCWEARQYYKDETNKLLYWIGTAFVAILAATGLLGARKVPNERMTFDFIHILAFHVVFAIVWSYYLYKQLNAEMFEHLGILIESQLRESQQLPPEGFVGFFNIKGHCLGKAMGHGRNLTRYANILLVLLYISVTSLPIFRGGFSAKDFVVNWSFLAATVVFIIILASFWLVFRHERRRVMAQIEEDWKNYTRLTLKES